MTNMQKRYATALNEIRSKVGNEYYNLLELPDGVKEVLKSTTDLETKTRMLEEMAKVL